MRLALLLAVALGLSTANAQVYFGVAADVGREYVDYESRVLEAPTAYLSGEASASMFFASARIGMSTALITYNYAEVPAAPGHYWDFSVDRCRDGATGRFAASGLCGSPARSYSIDEATMPLSGEIGAQLPLSNGARATRIKLGLGAFHLSPHSEVPSVQAVYGAGSVDWPFLTDPGGYRATLRGMVRLGSGGYRFFGFGAALEFGDL